MRKFLPRANGGRVLFFVLSILSRLWNLEVFMLIKLH